MVNDMVVNRNLIVNCVVEGALPGIEVSRIIDSNVVGSPSPP